MYIWLPKLGCFEPPFKFSFSVFILSLQLRYAINFFQNECQLNLRFSLNERSVLRHELCSFGSRLVLSPTIPTILTTRRSLPLSASRRTKRMLSQKRARWKRQPHRETSTALWREKRSHRKSASKESGRSGRQQNFCSIITTNVGYITHTFFTNQQLCTEMR